jgi:putative oxidoreductase
MRACQRSIADWIALALRVFLGGFYVVAGGVKIGDPGKFAEAVANYRLLPHELINLVAITLPWIEIVAGVALIAGVWLRSSVWLINAMTIMFIAAIASAVSRGLSIECGCFGTVGGRSVGLIAIAEDVGLLACGLWVAWRAAHRREPGAAREEAAVAPLETRAQPRASAGE